MLQNLLAERVSIRDLPTILEGISEACGAHPQRHPDHRARARPAGPPDQRHVHQRQRLHPAADAVAGMGAGLRRIAAGTGDERQLAMAPSKLQQFIAAVRAAFERQAQAGETPVLLTSPSIRPYVRSIVERFRPNVGGDLAERDLAAGADQDGRADHLGGRPACALRTFDADSIAQAHGHGARRARQRRDHPVHPDRAARPRRPGGRSDRAARRRAAPRRRACRRACRRAVAEAVPRKPTEPAPASWTTSDEAVGGADREHLRRFWLPWRAGSACQPPAANGRRLRP